MIFGIRNATIPNPKKMIAAAITALRLLLSTRIKTFYSEKPPSTLMTVPVVNAASSDAR